MNLEKIFYNSDCKYFKGHLPCKPHKLHGVRCEDCNYYSMVVGRILIIKLGAIGDVIRTTCLLPRIWSEYPNYEVWWLTYSPSVLPSSVDKILNLSVESIELVKSIDFDIAINLDKDDYACAIMNSIKADIKFGYYLLNSRPAPINQLAQRKFNTGLFDDVNQQNTLSYPTEIYQIMGWDYKGEEYLLDCDNSINWNIPNQGKRVVGLNTGCGERWVSRLYPDDKWLELIELIKNNGYFPMLLGGKQEHEKNLFFAEQGNCYYPGHFSLSEFISLIASTDLVVTAVTMAMHLAIGTKRKIVLINNIFNQFEFELYGRGEIVLPNKKCNCFFSPKCVNPDYFCLEHLPPIKIFESINRLLQT